jgi:type I restriction enzyme S subunit
MDQYRLYTRADTTFDRRVQQDDLDELPMPLPPADQQRRIADFLDDQVARIDNIIAARKGQLNLQAQRRQRSLDDSVDYNGQHRSRLALFARIQSGITVDAGRSTDKGVEVPYLRVANVQAGSLNLDEIKTIVIAPPQRERFLLKDGDVLMTEGGDLDKLGRGTVWRSEIPGAIHQNHVFAVRPDVGRLLPDYLAYVTACSAARAYFESTGNQTTNLASTSATKVLDLPIPVRTIEDQARLVAALDVSASSFVTLLDSLVRSVSLLEELKRSLITAAVTGEFDVSTADGSRVPA